MAHHGNTPAAWTGVMIILIGFVVGGIGLVIDNMPLFWVGVALLPVGAIVGKVMQKMGLGAETAGPLTGARSRPPRSTPVATPSTRAARVAAPALVAGAVLGRQRRAAPARPARARQLGVLPVAALTGTYCPGCGGLRAVNDLTRGDLAAAASSNLLFVGSLPLLGVLLGCAGSPTAGGAYDEPSARAAGSPERSCSRAVSLAVLGGAQPAGVRVARPLTPYRRGRRAAARADGLSRAGSARRLTPSTPHD